MKARLVHLAVLVVITPLGFATKFYGGPGAAWVNSYAGDIFYPIFWYFLFFFLCPNSRKWPVAAGVFWFSTAVEFTQLLDNGVLSWMRSSFIGRTLVGTGFVWADIFYYLVGSVLAITLYNKAEGQKPKKNPISSERSKL